jgi:hypothetical protein
MGDLSLEETAIGDDGLRRPRGLKDLDERRYASEWYLGRRMVQCRRAGR